LNNEISSKHKDFIFILNLYNSSKYSLLEEKTDELLQAYPEDHKIWNLHCISLARQNKYEESIFSFQGAITQCPKKALLFNSLGLTYLHKGDIENALDCFKNASEYNPSYYPSYINLGNAYLRASNSHRAIQYFEEAIQIDSKDIRGYINLSLLYKSIGRINQSIIFCEKAISLNRKYGLAHRHLSTLKTYETSADEHILLMQELITEEDLKDADLSDIYFGLGKALEDVGEYEDAFSYLNLGNSIHRKNIDFSIEDSRRYFESLKVDYENIKGLDIVKRDKKNLFVLGMPRSGTSLVEQILASHSQVVGGGELKHFLKSVKNSFRETKGLSFPNQLADIDINVLKHINEDYSASIFDLFGEHSYLVDKMPYNFMYIGLILLSLPDSKIIICERDPVENCFSIYKQRFGRGNRFAYSLKEIAQYYLLYHDLISFWKELYHERIFILKYENLINNQEKVSKDLIDYCNLTWEENCLFFYKNEREVRTASAAQVKKPIYNKSLDLSKNYANHIKVLNETLKRII
tara:strand:+ start:134 stop:1699 length:1566 start_codon:yes stop_codon:yes gene_type:complete